MTSSLRLKIKISLVAALFFSSAFLWARPLHPTSESGSSHAFCGTYRGRLQDQLRRDAEIRLWASQQRKNRSLEAAAASASKDVFDIAIIEDDGTIITPVNLFDLENNQVRLTPSTTGSFLLSTQAGQIDHDNLGARLDLKDDDSMKQVFQNGFHFPFRGETFESLFINSDGNITFIEGDSASTDRDLTRFNNGPPRLALFFADLNPETSPLGGIYFNQKTDRLLITWDHIRAYSDSGDSREVNIQAELFPDGSITITYGEISFPNGIVGWTSGGNRQMVQFADLSMKNGAVLTGAQSEKFSQTTQVSNSALAQKFYKNHPDRFDQLVVFTNFPYDLGNAFAYELNVKNDIQGIGLLETVPGRAPTPFFDYSATFGSQGMLQSYLSMNQLAAFPDDPDQVFFGTNSTLSIIGQEAGHRWLAYAPFLDNGNISRENLGRDFDHWSFFFNSEASVMEGNKIRDNGDGSFTTTESTRRFSPLDQYLMGLRAAEQVDPSFLVTNVTGTRRNSSSAPALGVTFHGTRSDLTVYDIIAAAGPRIPACNLAPKTFNQAFILLIQQGTTLKDPDLEKITRIKTRWEDFYRQATDGLGKVDARLFAGVPPPVVQDALPNFGSTMGGTKVYVSGQNFEPNAKVFFGELPASRVEPIDSTSLIAYAPAQTSSNVAVRVVNSDKQESAAPVLFEYQALVPATLSPAVLRIPNAIDSVDYRSNLGLNNLSSNEALVKISLLDQHGNLLKPAMNAVVPSQGYLQLEHVLREISGNYLMTGLEGTLAIESNQPVTGFLSQINNAANDPAIVDAVHEGNSHLILDSAANTSAFQSSLTVVNLSSRDGHVTLKAISRENGQGIGEALTSLPLKSNGYLRFDNILQNLGVQGEYAPVEIVSEDQLLLSAVSLVTDVSTHTGGIFTAHPYSESAQTQYILVARDDADFRTNLGLHNPGAESAQVLIELHDTEGRLVCSTNEPIQLFPGQSVQINGVTSYLRKSGGKQLTENSNNTYLKLSSDHPIQAYASLIRNRNNDSAIEHGARQWSQHTAS